jgi:hypothetical protein
MERATSRLLKRCPGGANSQHCLKLTPQWGDDEYIDRLMSSHGPNAERVYTRRTRKCPQGHQLARGPRVWEAWADQNDHPEQEGVRGHGGGDQLELLSTSGRDLLDLLRPRGSLQIARLSRARLHQTRPSRSPGPERNAGKIHLVKSRAKSASRSQWLTMMFCTPASTKP